MTMSSKGNKSIDHGILDENLDDIAMPDLSLPVQFETPAVIKTIEEKLQNLSELSRLDMIEDNLNRHMHSLGQEVERQRKELEVEKQMSQDLETNLEEVINQKSELELRLEQFEAQIAEQAQQHSEQQAVLMQQIQKLNSKISNEMLPAETLTVKTAESESLRVELQTKQAEIIHLKGQLSEVNSILAEERKSFETRAADHLRSHWSLEKSLNSEKDRRERAELEIVELQFSLSELKNEKVLEKENIAVQTEVATHNKQREVRRIEQLERQLRELDQENLNIENQSQTLRSEIQDLKSRNRRQIDALNSEIDSLHDEVRNKSRLIDKLKSEASQFQADADSGRNSHIDRSAKPNSDREDLLRQFFEVQADAKVMKFAMDKVITENEKQKSDIEQLHQVGLEKERNLRTAHEEIRELKRQIEMNRTELQKEKDLVIQRTMDANSGRLNFQMEIQRLQASEERLKEDLLRLKEENQNGKAQNINLHKNLDSAKEEARALKAQIMAQSKDLNVLKEENHLIKERTASQNIEVQRIKRDADQYKFEAAQLSSQGSQLITERNELKEQLEEVKSELSATKAAYIASLNCKDDKSNEKMMEQHLELQKLTTELANREQQLRAFAERVDKEKSQVMSYVKGLADELRSAGTLHPLKDYLSFTELELSRIEAQLKKTPTSSDERPRLEQLVNQLIEQRDFLRSVVSKSEVQLRERADQLMALAQSGKLSQLPPPFAGSRKSKS